MDDLQFNALLRNEIENALGYYDSEYSTDRVTLMDYYMGEEYGNEQEGRSQVVTTEVADTIEFIMPSLMRMFTQTDEFVKFMPRQPEDVEGAKQATSYANYVLNCQNNGFVVLHNFFKDALLQKLGVVKVYYDETEDMTEEEYTGLSDDELTLLLQDPAVEIVSQNTEESGEEGVDEMGMPFSDYSVKHDVVIKRMSYGGMIKVDNIPPEEFLVSKRSSSLEDADFVAHRTTMKVSDLIQMGYDRELVEKYAGYTELDTTSEVQNRFQDVETTGETDSSDMSMRDVLVVEAYIKADYDDDGIAELRRVVTLGQGFEIVENDTFDHIPFACLSPILMPHRLIGRSIAELIMDLQLIKSTVLRQLLDNIYLTNNARVAAVEGQVNLDDLLNSRAGGIVRMRQPNAVQVLQPPMVGQNAFSLLQYLDEIKEQRTGLSKASMGLDADALQSTTATAVAAQMSAAQGKIEMIARVFAETGVKQLFRLVLTLCLHHGKKEQMIRLNNKFVPIDPSNWKHEYDLSVNVGLGSGQTNEKMAFLAQMAQKQEQILLQTGVDNPLVSLQQYRNTLAELANMAGFKDASRFFKNPEDIPPQPQQPPPPSEAEMKMQFEQQKFQAELELQKAKQDAELALKREELQMKMQIRQEELRYEAQLRGFEQQVGGKPSTNLPRVD
tara:strand:+ start:2137 stop:4143 length:2007 start_codon:yes stop_codon:yes gene_type:complete